MPKILLLGLGCIGGCVYQMLSDYFDNIELTILDKMDNLEQEVLKYKSTSKLNMDFKVNIIQGRIKKKNYIELLTPLFKSVDAVINLTTEVSSKLLVLLADECNVVYLDAAVEMFEKCFMSIHQRHKDMRELKTKKTALLEHGMNPGVISYLCQMGESLCDFKPDIVYITEYDTHVLKESDSNIFYNTWSPYGLYEEITEKSEMSWCCKLSEEFKKKNGITQYDQSIIFSKPGYMIILDSWTPDPNQPFDTNNKGILYKGYVVTHGETETIGKRIGNINCAFVFRICPEAQKGLNKWESSLAPKYVQMFGKDIKHGSDTIGVLLGNKESNKTFWIGNKVTVEDAMKVSVLQNGATITVAAACLAGIKWCLNNPDEGILFPDDIKDYMHIWNDCKKYMGQIIHLPGPSLSQLNTIPNTVNIYYVFTKITSNNIDIWLKYAQKQSQGKAVSLAFAYNKNFNVDGSTHFLKVLQTNIYDIYVAYIVEGGPKEVTDEDINFYDINEYGTSDSYFSRILMFMTVTCKPNSSVSTHLGISTSIEGVLKNVKGLSMNLHKFAVEQTKILYPSLKYMINSPSWIMESILIKSGINIHIGTYELKKELENSEMTYNQYKKLYPDGSIEKFNQMQYKLNFKYFGKDVFLLDMMEKYPPILSITNKILIKGVEVDAPWLSNTVYKPSGSTHWIVWEI